MKNAFGFSSLLLLTLLAATACQSPVSSMTKTKGVTLTFSSAARTVVPNWSTTIASYDINLHCTTSTLADITTTASSPSTSATISNVPQGTWTVSVSAFNSSSVNVGSGSGTAVVASDGTSSPVAIAISDTQSGSGGYQFTFEFPSSVVITSVTGQLLTNTGGTISGSAGSLVTLSTFTTDSGTGNEVGTFSNASIASGSYILQLTFYRGTVSAGSYAEPVNVWDNVVSDQWLDSGGNLHAYRTFAATEFNSSDASLASLTATVSGTALALNPTFASSTMAYTNGSASAITLIPTGSVLGQGLLCQIGAGAWASINSGVPLTVSPGSTVSIKVTAPDGVTSQIYTYSLTTLFGETAPLSLAGTVSTLAGSGAAAFADGTGNAASFNNPRALATDGTNVYVADALNNCIRKVVISTGAVTTLQSGFNCPEGLAIGGTFLYISDSSNNQIYKMSTSDGSFTVLAGAGGSGYGTPGYQDGPGTVALFNYPKGLATDGTNLYVADGTNNRIRKIVISTGYVSTLAGSGSAGFADGTGTAASFNNPSGLATDGTYLYVTDMDNYRIRKIVIATGVVTTLAGSGATTSVNGIGTSAAFDRPYGLATDGTNLYVAGNNDHAIRKIVISTGLVTTLAGTLNTPGSSDGASALFHNPYGVTTDGTHLYVADTNNNLIREIQ
jgi:hypothetical protein